MDAATGGVIVAALGAVGAYWRAWALRKRNGKVVEDTPELAAQVLFLRRSITSLRLEFDEHLGEAERDRGHLADLRRRLDRIENQS